MRAIGQRFARCGGTAVIETAIVMPLYLIVLFGLLYFGYATLAKQRQTMAAAYSAWLPGDQRADLTLTRFFPWTVSSSTPPVAVAQPGVSGVTSSDHELNVRERERLNDPYYGTVIQTQLVAGTNSLGGAGEDTFDRERVTVSLWNLAFGSVVQGFSWSAAQGGLTPRNTPVRGPYYNYLNADSDTAKNAGGGFIAAGVDASPQIGRYENMVSDMLDGVNSTGHWLTRRQATLDATYQPSFFSVVYADNDAPPLTAGTYFSGNYAQPTYKPTSSLNFDVTGRGTAARLAASDQGGSYNAVLDDAYRVTGQSQPLADSEGIAGSVLSRDPLTGATVSVKDAMRRQ